MPLGVSEGAGKREELALLGGHAGLDAVGVAVGRALGGLGLAGALAGGVELGLKGGDTGAEALRLGVRLRGLMGRRLRPCLDGRGDRSGRVSVRPIGSGFRGALSDGGCGRVRTGPDWVRYGVRTGSGLSLGGVRPVGGVGVRGGSGRGPAHGDRGFVEPDHGDRAAVALDRREAEAALCGAFAEEALGDAEGAGGGGDRDELGGGGVHRPEVYGGCDGRRNGDVRFRYMAGVRPTADGLDAELLPSMLRYT